MSDILTWEIRDKSDIINPPSYNGEFKKVRTELQDNINRLIQNFEEEYKVIVTFTNSENRVNIRLVIDLRESKFP